jgi:hypothetical protein
MPLLFALQWLALQPAALAVYEALCRHRTTLQHRILTNTYYVDLAKLRHDQ